MFTRKKKRLLDALRKSSGMSSSASVSQLTRKELNLAMFLMGPDKLAAIRNKPVSAEDLAAHYNEMHKMVGAPEDFTAEEFEENLQQDLGNKNVATIGSMRIHRITGNSPDAGKYVLTSID